MRRLILTLCLGLLTAPAARGEITPDNVCDYLRPGELSFGFQVSFKNIDCIDDTEEAAERAARLEAILARNPRNLSAAADLIELYKRGCRKAQAAEIAKQALPIFRERLEQERSEAAAVGYAQTVLAAETREEYLTAYQALQPFLESGQAGRETCITAVEISMAAAKYDLAERVAGLCLRIHPGCAELHNYRFLISIADALYARVAEIVQTSAQEVLEEVGLENFITGLLEILNTEIDTPSLLQAIELEPSNYLYNLEAALFEALTLCISKAALRFLATETREAGLEDLLLRTGGTILAPLRKHLEQAEAVRPPRDIQVFLVRVIAGICLGEYETAEHYGLLCIGIRPDLPAGYDALITRTFAPFAGEGDFPDAEVCNRAIGIYKAKINQTGETAADYHQLAMLYFAEYLEAEDQDRSPLLEKARQYTNKALEIDSGFSPARLLSANVHITAGKYRRAIEILEEIPTPEDTDLAGARLHNLGIARILDGKRAAGIASLEEALELQPDNQQTRDALLELGRNPDRIEAR